MSDLFIETFFDVVRVKKGPTTAMRIKIKKRGNLYVIEGLDAAFKGRKYRPIVSWTKRQLAHLTNDIKTGVI